MGRLCLAPIKRRQSPCRGDQWNAVPLRQRMGALHMVGMFVGNNRAAEVSRRQSLLRQRRCQLPHADPGIDQDRDFPRANQCRIAGRAGRQRLDGKSRIHMFIVPERVLPGCVKFMMRVLHPYPSKPPFRTCPARTTETRGTIKKEEHPMQTALPLTARVQAGHRLEIRF